MKITGSKGAMLRANLSRPNTKQTGSQPLLNKKEYDTISFSGKMVKPKKGIIKIAGEKIVAVFKAIQKFFQNYAKKEYEVLYKKGPFHASGNNPFMF